MSISTRSVAMFGLASLFSANLCANNFSYNTMEFRIGGSPTSVGGEFSMQYTDNSHFVAKLDSAFEGDWDVAAGMGFNGPAGQFSDIRGQMLLHNVKVVAGDIVGDEFMTEFNVGMRLWLYDNIEMHGKYGKLVEDDDAHSVYDVGLRFHSTQQLVLGMSLRNNGVHGSQILMTSRFQY